MPISVKSKVQKFATDMVFNGNHKLIYEIITWNKIYSKIILAIRYLLNYALNILLIYRKPNRTEPITLDIATIFIRTAELNTFILN